MYLVDCKKENCSVEALFSSDGWLVIARQAFWLMLVPMSDAMPYQRLAYVDYDLLRTLSDKLLFWLPGAARFCRYQDLPSEQLSCLPVDTAICLRSWAEKHRPQALDRPE